MTQYLIRKTTHTTGEVFFDVTRAKESEAFIVVDAESKEEALEMADKPNGLLSVVPSSFNNGPISRALSKTYRKAESGRLSLKPEKAPIPPRKDSE
ncbi:DUF1381 domain-containing protein [Staphylococcus saprophyticus]|uniref:DUF1381 domain-containing protein n=1 Tax=Staphylococcus saprophyticus TaxID=29385 RepID=UPI00280BE6CA|nr:hypothetical protein [Staphylococcus saprophyticus]WMM14408.1 hypothetical protein RCG45_06410 [Staphylococcus saprophyticus]